MAGKRVDLFQNGYIDGITIVNTEGEILFSAKFNAKLSNPDEYYEVVGKRLLDIYSNLTPESSTLYRAMQSGSQIYIEDQYLERENKKGIYTSSLSIPIYSGERIVGAIELSSQRSARDGEARYEINLDADNFRTGDLQKMTKNGDVLYAYDDIIAVNDKMKRAKEYIKTVSGSDLPVLISGEEGTGKEMFAQVIHRLSARKNQPFLSQNCAAIPPALMERVLFGAPPNPDSGMPESRGILELASGGTLFLEEIETMPYSIQYKLLHMLQYGTVPEVPMNRPADVRLIVSVSSDPAACLENGTLRKDVYYSLGKLSIAIPLPGSPGSSRRWTLLLSMCGFMQPRLASSSRGVPSWNVFAGISLSTRYCLPSIRHRAMRCARTTREPTLSVICRWILD